MSLKITNATMARVETSFRQLASAAQALNTAAEDLSKVIRHLDASLKKLGLGVSAWVPVSGLSDETQYWTIELGYANVDGKWGLALREVTGYHLDSNDQSEQIWPYNDAPRKNRAEAVDKIPDLLEKLLQQTQETTRSLQDKIEQATEFNTVVAELTPKNEPVAPQQWQRPELGGLHGAAHGSERRPEREESLGAKPPAPPVREGQPLPAERVPSERPTPPNPPVARFREEEPKTPSGPGIRPAGAARIL